MKTLDLNWRGHRLQLGHRTRIMGILNVTPDSFSDGGHFFDADAALARAESMIAEGADIIDIGGESSRPFSEPVAAEEETRRVVPIIEHLAQTISVPISIDTTKSEVARRAMAAGAAIINDISAGRFDPEMSRVAAETGAVFVLMHMKGTPKTMQKNPVYSDLIGEICDYLETAMNTAEAAGVARQNLIVDPGIGFGKTVSHNLEIIKKIDQFHRTGAPVLLGPSRKAFIRNLLAGSDQKTPDADGPIVSAGTQAAVAAAVRNGVEIIRVHDVAETRTTLKIVDAVRNQP
ncbi:MAG: dihydropteroate synthase [Thermodesulfobacteriota bacterium]